VPTGFSAFGVACQVVQQTRVVAVELCALIAVRLVIGRFPESEI
jgi:hypothetical protein